MTKHFLMHSISRLKKKIRIVLHTGVARKSAGFTLIETLVAISILTISIVAPMSLVAQSLQAAYYSADQMVAFQLGQEAIEAVRHIRDNNLIKKVHGQPYDAFLGDQSTNSQTSILNHGTFVIDTRSDHITNVDDCGGIAPPLRTNGGPFYAYGRADGVDDSAAAASCSTPPGWTDSIFTRTVVVTPVQYCPLPYDTSLACEVNVTVTVQWKSPHFTAPDFVISENLYRWADGS